MAVRPWEWIRLALSSLWKSRTVPQDKQARVIFTKWIQRVCSSHRKITLLSLPGKVSAGEMERRVRQIAESQINFRPDHETMDQLFTLTGILKGDFRFSCVLWTQRRLLQSPLRDGPCYRPFRAHFALQAASQSLTNACWIPSLMPLDTNSEGL